MANLALLVVCFLAGVGARRFSALPPDSHRVLNTWVMYVSLPALVFRTLQGTRLDVDMALASASLWLVFVVPALAGWWRIRAGADKRQVGALALCSGLGNTAFVGLPLLEALAGKEALGPAAVADQLGSFLAFSLLAVPFATWLSGRSMAPVERFRRFIQSPTLLALAVALSFRGTAIPTEVDFVLKRFADMLSPLALASIGWQFDVSSVVGQGRRMALGLGWKLVVAPALVLGLLWWWKGPLAFAERVVVAQAAMAPMVTAGVLAADSGLDTRLSAGLIAVGVPLSLLTVPIWWHFLGSWS